MMKADLDDRVQLVVDVPSEWADVVIPAGTQGHVVYVYETPREGYAVDVAIPDKSSTTGFKYDNVVVEPEQFRVVERHPS
jgi:hypothetical protein